MTEAAPAHDRITKRFPGVVALDDVGSRCGRRGARPARRERRRQIDAAEDPVRRAAAGRGRIVFDGEPVASPRPTRRRRGIVTIYQEFNLIPTLTVAENMLIGREPGRAGFVNWRRMRAAREGGARPASASDRPAPAGARLSRRRAADGRDRPRPVDGARLIVMDEPTAALTEPRSTRCSRSSATCAAEGIAHHLRHPPAGRGDALCDRVTVLRDGRLVGTRAGGRHRPSTTSSA